MEKSVEAFSTYRIFSAVKISIYVPRVPVIPFVLLWIPCHQCADHPAAALRIPVALPCHCRPMCAFVVCAVECAAQQLCRLLLTAALRAAHPRQRHPRRCPQRLRLLGLGQRLRLRHWEKRRLDQPIVSPLSSIRLPSMTVTRMKATRT